MFWFRRLCLLFLPLPTFVFAAGYVFGQSDPDEIGQVLGEEILAPSVAVHQVKSYILSRVAPPPTVTNAPQWTEEEKRLRQHLLQDVVFHGWPDEWVNTPPRFEDVGVIETGQGYRLRKLRYEIVPGFQSVAILYEPEKLRGKVPAILNVNGHVGPPGKAVEYKQKRCINFAKHGILALNLEWFFFGELRQDGNQHWYSAHLDLVGANGLGIFLLEMRRGLDYLYNHANVDRSRLGVTGLSGGGWQTIFLSSLDERVKAAVPVAGYSSVSAKVEARKYGDLGDIEQNGTDLFAVLDYTHLTAMMAPRPTLLIYDAEDDCCFRAPLVKPLIFFPIRYADDFVVLVSGTQEEAIAEKTALADHLHRTTGLELSPEKTKVTSVKDGFEFLGFHVTMRWDKRYGYFPRVEIPKAKAVDLRHKIKQLTRRNTTSCGLGLKLREINPILRGWAAYYRHCARAGRVFNSLDWYSTSCIWRWLRKKRPKTRVRDIMRDFSRSSRRTTRRLWRDGPIEQFLLAWTPVRRFRLGWMGTPDFAMSSGEPDA